MLQVAYRLVRYPPRVPARTRVAEPVSTVGVYATILDLAGIAVPGRLHVGSLLPAITGTPAGAPVIAERFVTPGPPGTPSPLALRDRRYRVYRSGTLKLVQTSRGDTLLFDLARDPGEHEDLAPERPRVLARIRAELDTWVAALGLPPLDAPVDSAATPAIDPAARERLKALGYVE